MELAKPVQETEGGEDPKMRQLQEDLEKMPGSPESLREPEPRARLLCKKQPTVALPGLAQ